MKVATCGMSLPSGRSLCVPQPDRCRGDKPNTEDEVFNACEEAVQEIMDLICRINGSGNTHHFIVTAEPRLYL